MTELLLPGSPRRGLLRAFWLSVSAGLGAVVTSVVSLAGGRGWLWGLLCGCLVALPGLQWPLRVHTAYRAWNRLARAYGRVATRMLTGLAFVVFLAAGRTGAAQLSLSRPPGETSMWRARRSQSADEYRHQHPVLVAERNRRGLGAVRQWARRSGRSWVAPLVPFLFLLRAVDAHTDTQRDEVPSDVYTLY